MLSIRKKPSKHFCGFLENMFGMDFLTESDQQVDFYGSIRDRMSRSWQTLLLTETKEEHKQKNNCFGENWTEDDKS